MSKRQCGVTCSHKECYERKTPRRHRFSKLKVHMDFKDGCYQTCERCGAVKFEGERYTYLRKPCK